MYPKPSPINPHQRQSFSGQSNNVPVAPGYGRPSNAHYGARAHPPHPRSNTAPSVFYPVQHGPRPYPSPPPMPQLHSTPALPASLMPGKRRETAFEAGRESALFFQPSRQPMAPTAAPMSLYNDSVTRVGPSETIARPVLPPKPMVAGVRPLDHSTDTTSSSSTRPFSQSRPMSSEGPNMQVSPTRSPMQTSAGNLPTKPFSSPSSEDLARALAESLAESSSTRTQHDEEEELLARALEESLKTSRRSPVNGPNLHREYASTSTGIQPSSSPALRRSTPPADDAWAHEDNFVDSSPTAQAFSISINDDERRLQMERDAQLARELAAQEELTPAPASPTSSSRGRSSRRPTHTHSSQPSLSGLPDYETVVKSSSTTSPPVESSTSTSPSANSGNADGTVRLGSLPAYSRSPQQSSPSAEAPPETRIAMPIPQRDSSQEMMPRPISAAPGVPTMPMPALGRSQSAQAVLATPVPLIPTGPGSGQRPMSNPTANNRVSAPSSVRRATSANALSDSSSHSTSPVITASVPPLRMNQIPEGSGTEEEDLHAGPSNTSARRPSVPSISSSVNASSFVESELLMGISLGFTAPSISSGLAPMQGPIPNIISLPYGKCPPLHIQAPSWKQLLKLLARLGESRIEPTVEALAVTKQQPQLRVVIQFVKVHHASEEWRTIIYLTIDHPVPPGLPNAFKYANGDVSMLPFSYTLSQIPALLRDGADSPLSKYYTIPVTDALPYPNLPVRLDNLSRYLQAALVESRKTMNDSSSGMRKLAKMVDGFYPSDPTESSVIGDEVPLPERRMGTGFIRRAFGFGGRSGRESRGGNANQDTFEYITPYRLDEYG